jgi:phage FluMu protein Com
MSLEFKCSQCGKLLRVPDGSAGRKAKCPNCGAVVEVPAARLPLAEDNQYQVSPPKTPPRPQAGVNPFADDTATSHVADRSFDAENPYASSAAVAVAPSAVEAPSGELRHTRIGFEQVLKQTWAIFMDQLGLCMAATLLLVGFVIVTYIAGIALGFSFFAVMDQAGGMGMAALVPVAILVIIVAFVGYTWLQLGVTILMIRICRGDRAEISALFAGGPFLMKGIGLGLLVGAINIGVSVLCKLPSWNNPDPMVDLLTDLAGNLITYVISLFFFLCLYLIVGRKMGVIESIQNSARFMQGNKLTLFLVHLVAGIIGGFFMLITCMIGGLFVLPYFMVLSAVVYLLATGQPTAVQRRAALRQESSGPVIKPPAGNPYT